MYSNDICSLSSAADRVQLGPPSLRSIVSIGVPKCDNWKNGYISLTQPHVNRLRSNFADGSLWHHESCGIAKTHYESNPRWRTTHTLYEEYYLQLQNLIKGA